MLEQIQRKKIPRIGQTAVRHYIRENIKRQNTRNDESFRKFIENLFYERFKKATFKAFHGFK